MKSFCVKESEGRNMDSFISGVFGSDEQCHGIFRDLVPKPGLGIKKIESNSALLVFAGDMYAGVDNNGSLLLMKGDFYQKRPFFSALELEDDLGDSYSQNLHIMHHMLKYDELSLLNDLYGEFFGIYIRGDEIVLLSDKRASIPLFYAVYKDAFLFSSSPLILLKAIGQEPVISENNFAETAVFGNLVDSDTLFEGIYCLKPGTIITYSRLLQKVEKKKYLFDSDIHYKKQIEDEELSYELSRLMIRALELVTRGINQVSLCNDCLESLLCCFMMPFERIRLKIFIPDIRHKKYLEQLGEFYNKGRDLELEMDSAHFSSLPVNVYCRFYPCSFQEIGSYSSEIAGYVEKKYPRATREEKKLLVRDYILENADLSIFQKILNQTRIVRNPFQEPFFKEYLRSINPELIITGEVFNLIAKSRLIKKAIGSSRIKRYKSILLLRTAKSNFNRYFYTPGIEKNFNNMEFIKSDQADIIAPDLIKIK